MGKGFSKKRKQTKYEAPPLSNNNNYHGAAVFDQPRLPSSPQPTIPVVANYQALFNYDKSTAEDITIRKLDPLLVLNKNHEEWWYVKNLRTGEVGYVPYNYITAIDNLEIKDWFFPNTSRREAERLLEYLDNEPGVFLVRDSEQEKGKGWSLSVLDQTDDRKDRHTKHYKIRKTDDGGCYISTKTIFHSLDELVNHYSKNPNGLCRRLTVPCPKEQNFAGFKDIWEESRDNIELGEIIGSGNFGEVYKGLWRKKHVVAVKTVKFNSSDKNVANSIKEFKKELEINKKLKHEKIVRLWCVCTKGEPIFLVTEYMANGNLLSYLRNDNQNRVGFKEIIDMATQIAAGMKYLESMKCVHRDLAARNILVGERNIVKIADFGLAQMLDDNSKAVELSKDENNKFPVKWTAPEVFPVDAITLKRQYTIKSDVWSYGIVLYELITKGGTPYPGMTHMQVISEVKTNKYRMPKPVGLCNDTFYNIMSKCWEEDADSRPTFEALYNIFNDYTISTEKAYRDV